MITVIIILITVIVSWKCFTDVILFEKLSLRPSTVIAQKQYYRLISHSLVHIDWQHLLFNMLTLFFMGISVERTCTFYFGNAYSLIFILLYGGGAIFASVYTLISQRNNVSYSAVGASGAVSAIVFTFILFNPLQKLYVMAIPIGIPAIIFGIIFIITSLYLAKRNNDSIAHDAHLSGAIWGFIFPILLKPQLFTTFINQIFN